MKRIMIDIGSLTIKVYKAEGNKASLISRNSINLKEGFSPSLGIMENHKNKLISFLKEIKEENPDIPVKLYATALFRKMNTEVQNNLSDLLLKETGLELNIIDHESESFYLEQALVSNCVLPEKILLLNTGGASTELIIIENKKTIDRYNLDIGAITIYSQFPNINNEFSEHTLKEVVAYVSDKLPSIPHQPRIAFYSGGVLTYMKRVNYPLLNNELFNDTSHPFLIHMNNYIKKNKSVFSEISLNSLECMMPESPKWMHGVRSCSAIAQAIYEKYGVEIIIPSDSNLIDGIAKQDNI